MTTIYLIRHGEAQGNVDRRFQGHFDGKITDNGKKQLAYLSQRFKKIGLTAICSSPLSRAVDTAYAINKPHELPVVIDRGLIEICGGAFEGMKYADIPERFPEQWEHWNNEPHQFIAPGGESMRYVYDRMRYTMNRIVHGNMGGSVAVITHGCALRSYLCYLLDKPFDLLESVPWGENTCVTRIEFDFRFNHEILYMNDISHLPEDLSALAKQNCWKKNGNAADDLGSEVIHVKSGELFLENDDLDITAGDLITPQGSVRLTGAQLHIIEGKMYLNDDKIKLTKTRDNKDLVILSDETLENTNDDDFEETIFVDQTEETEALPPLASEEILPETTPTEEPSLESATA